MVGVTRGTARGRRLRVDQQVTVGSASDNDLVLVDEGVTPRHCLLVREGSGLVALYVRPHAERPSEKFDYRGPWCGPGGVLRIGEAELLLHRAFDASRISPGSEIRFGRALGHSEPMRAVFAVLEEVASTGLAVLLEGETGTGKRLLARAVHETSPRRVGPFVLVDCSSDPQLLESELFGIEEDPHEVGRTGPLNGAFEMAHGGTLVLDEVADLPGDVQSRVLEVCQSGTVRRIGGKSGVPVDLRIVTTARRPLSEEVRRGRFQAELYFLLSAVNLAVLPLRQRREDIAPLIEQVLADMSRRDARLRGLTLPADLMAFLLAHEWPGNVRELEDILAQGVYAWAARADAVPLSPSGISFPSSEIPPSFRPDASYRKTRAAFQNEFEQRYVRWLLDRHQGNISAAAREAKMDRKHLYDLARKHGLRFSSRPP
jgi:DNA-binding NtrC family response regulator